MPDEVIARIHSIADRQNVPEGVEFRRVNGAEFEDLLDIPVVVQDDESTSSSNSDSSEDDPPSADKEGVDDQQQEQYNDLVSDDDSMVTAADEQNHDDQVNEDGEQNDEIVIDNVDERPNATDDIIDRADRSVNLDVNAANIIPDGEARRRRPPQRDPSEGYSLNNVGSIQKDVKCSQTEHEHAFAQYVESRLAYVDATNNMQFAADHLLFTQLCMNAGIKAFGQKGVDAVVKEMKQFHDREVVKPILPNDVTADIRKRALGYLMFLKRKRSGDIKGRGCADGRPQRVYKTKMETSSPTVFTESIFIGSAMDAMEGRDVAHVDIPGAFLQTAASDDTIIRLQGVLVHTLLKINPSWEQYVIYEGRKRTPTIYSRAIKALYGTVDAAKLFFDNLSSFLSKNLGFEPNLYDNCVMNKQIDGSQCTIMFHVDDLKISHKSEDVVTMIINALSDKFGGIMPLSISRGKLHDYLGMTFNYETPGQVMIHMYQYIHEMLKSIPDKYKEGIGSATPAPSNLYDIRDESADKVELLSEQDKNEYHTITAQLLYLSTRARPDLQTSIAFHCTRVKNPDTDDQKKLARSVRYLMKTAHLPMILKCNDDGIIQWWVDASFAVHEDMRSRTGMQMSLGTGTIYGTSQKQKINTGSSTEAELVGARNYLPFNIWLYNF